MTLYIRVLNAFRIPYLVIYDEDPVGPELCLGGLRHDSDRFKEAQRTFKENEKIENAVDPKLVKH